MKLERNIGHGKSKLNDSGTSLPIRAVDLCKRLSREFQVRDLSLAVDAGEFFCLLGPSGSGKSTLLGLIGGWVVPDSGSLLLGSTDYTAAPPFQRPIRTCFQKGGFLFPHMTVRENIGYALKVKGTDPQQIDSRVRELAAQVGLSGFERRRPLELSGGEAQRVAIARALADPQPILLLDEIQTGLDTHLRASIRELLVELTVSLHVTTIYVTHDASEALGLASRLNSRLGVLNEGHLVQVGTAAEVYSSPSTSFVASFLGDINLLMVKEHNGNTLLTTGGNVFRCEKAIEVRAKYIGIRQEAITFEPRQRQAIELRGRVQSTELRGSTVRVMIRVNNDSIAIQISGIDCPPSIGEEVTGYLAESDLVLLEE